MSRFTSHIAVRRDRGGWRWQVIYLDEPEASGLETTKERAAQAAHRAQRELFDSGGRRKVELQEVAR